MVQNNYGRLKDKLNERFGHIAMRDRYIADAKIRKRLSGETFRDFGQALEDLYRRAYPENPDMVQECAIKSFLDKCSEDYEFRLNVKRAQPKDLQAAVTCAMQEDCIRIGERDNRDRPVRKPVYSLNRPGADPEYNNYHRDTRDYRQRFDRYTDNQRPFVKKPGSVKKDGLWCGRVSHQYE